MEQQLYMRANSAIKSLFLFQQKLDICGIATIYARKQRYKKLVPSSTKNSFCQCAQTAKKLVPISTKNTICLCAQAALQEACSHFNKRIFEVVGKALHQELCSCRLYNNNNNNNKNCICLCE